MYLMIFFFFNDPATTEIYPLSLHDALPIWRQSSKRAAATARDRGTPWGGRRRRRRHNRRDVRGDRKSTRLNSSHLVISYAVFCLKKKKHQLLNSGNNEYSHKLNTHVCEAMS